MLIRAGPMTLSVIVDGMSNKYKNIAERGFDPPTFEL